jgi:hypothetical protein
MAAMVGRAKRVDRHLVAVCCALAGPAAAAPASQIAMDVPSFGLPETPTFAAFVTVGATVRIPWTQVTGAVRYHVSWTDARGHVTEIETSSPTFERDHVDPGRYTLAVAAVDVNGTTSERTPAHPFVVVAVRATPPGSDGVAGPTRGAFALGTSFTAPGMHCALGDTPVDTLAHGPPGNTIRATAAGAFHLRCANATGSLLADMPVVIAPVIVAADDAELERGRTTVAHLAVASVAALGEDLDITARGDVAMGSPRPTPDGFDVPITIAPTARSATLVVASAGLELGHADLSLAAAAPDRVEADGDRSAWWAADLGGQIGAFVPVRTNGNAPDIGRPTAARDAISSGPLFGPRIGLFPTARVGIEAEAAFLAPGYQQQGGVALLVGGRAQLAARVLDSGRYGLRVLAGAGAISALREFGTARTGASGEVHYGAAVTVETRTDLWLRLQGVDVITTAQNGGYAHSIEVQLGVVTRIGRRDRW